MSDSTANLEAATDTALAKRITQWLVPAMLTVIGAFVTFTGNRIAATQDAQGKDIAQIRSDIRDVNTRLDAQVIRQVDSNTKHIDKLEDRVQVLERAVPTH